MRLRKDMDHVDEADILFISQISDALAHPARLNIFKYIMQENRKLQKVCNKDIVANFDYAQATVSQHVKKLLDSGLLEVKKEDKFSYYFANMGILVKYVNTTKKFSL
ncbi:MAG: helix-turn-helix domain-containing protein [Clostridia bacterium]|nr:helix-turn-helix domain-containing protein [Clostridia bacterium]